MGMLSMLRWLAMGAMLIAVSITDVRHRIVPDVLVAGIVAVQVCYLVASATSVAMVVQVLLAHVGSAALVIGVLAAACTIAHRATGHDGMGGGDVKLVGALAFVLGVHGLMVALFAASLAAIVSSLVKRRTMKETFPFCPYLSFGWLIALLVA